MAVAIGAVLYVCCLFLAKAADVSRECHDKYGEFQRAETRREALEAALAMYEGQCWPALQAAETLVAAPITDCHSLGPHIIQMTADQETTDNPRIIKFVLVEPMTDKVRADMNRRRRYPSTPPTGATRPLDCIAEARFNRLGTKLVQFYLERDPDGEEFYGMNMLYQQY